MTPQFDPACVDAASFDHPVDNLRIIETHISWVFLTGRFAYKIKKPVNLDFVDFHTLDLRKHFCETELRLNRKLAPQLYLDVIPVGGTFAQPRFGSTPAIDYAVRMHQFAQHERLDHLLAEGQLNLQDGADLGAYIAEIHLSAQRADDDDDFGKIRSVVSPIFMNYRTLDDLPLSDILRDRLYAQRQRDVQLLRRLRKTLSQRHADGFIRDCHGDLHLGNLVRLNHQIVAFDRLEFDPALRWIDVINEAAFPYMDFIHNGRTDLAFEFLNAYLERTGDYAGLAVLPLYAAYKAIIRAKVSACNTSMTASLREKDITMHVDCAARLSRRTAPKILLMHGFSCSGKSRVANTLKSVLPAIRLRADVERKRSFGLAPLERAAAKPGGGIYSASATQALYQRLLSLVRHITDAGFHAIVDATFLMAWQRTLFLELAESTAYDLVIIDCKAPVSVLRERLARRNAADDDPSDATTDVLTWQLENSDALTTVEKAYRVAVNTDGNPDLPGLAKALLKPQ
ncbi:MAG: AAA family ATPase [Gammaproteobacteria bacterium]|nr:AAA family ATPase [Gammaproteobacteria bacterium]